MSSPSPRAPAEPADISQYIQRIESSSEISPDSWRHPPHSPSTNAQHDKSSTARRQSNHTESLPPTLEHSGEEGNARQGSFFAQEAQARPSSCPPRTQSQKPPSPPRRPQPTSLHAEFDSLHDIEAYRKKLSAHQENVDSVSKFYSHDKLRSENDSLRQSISLRDMRIQSLENIINIQNNELLNESSSNSEPARRATLLAEAWRRKVYSLLLEMHSLRHANSQLSLSHSKQLHQQNLKLDSLTYKHSLMVEKLADAQAKLDISRSDASRLHQELEHAAHRERLLTAKLHQSTNVTHRLKEQLSRFFDSSFNDFSSLLHKKSSQLDALTKRLQFSESRLSMLSAVISRSETLHNENISKLQKKLHQQDSLIAQQKQKLHDMNVSTETLRELEKEVDTLKKERDYIIEKNNHDLETVRKSALHTEQQLEQKLHAELELRNQYKERLREANQEVVSTREKYDSLKSKYQQTEEHLRRYVEEARQLREQCQQQFEHIEEKIRQGVEVAVGKTEDELQLMKGELSRMREERDAQVQEIDRLQKAMESMQSEHEKDSRKKQEYLDMKMAAKESEMQTLQRERDMLMESNRRLGGVLNFGVPPVVAQGARQQPKAREATGSRILDRMQFAGSESKAAPNEGIMSQLDNVESLVESLLNDS